MNGGFDKDKGAQTLIMGGTEITISKIGRLATNLAALSPPSIAKQLISNRYRTNQVTHANTGFKNKFINLAISLKKNKANTR
jgi:hypothetical protein